MPTVHMSKRTHSDFSDSSSEEDNESNGEKPPSFPNRPLLDSSTGDGADSGRNTGDIRVHNPLLHGCRRVRDTYERISHISEGTYGIVLKARDLATDNVCALKQIKFDDDLTQLGFPLAAFREINVLMALQHDHILRMREVVVGDGFDQVFIAMDYYDFDLQSGLARIRDTTDALSTSELKGILQQLLRGVQYVHTKSYVHRDIKPSNILMRISDGEFRIVLADFGLARRYQQSPAKHMTPMVCTLWYRAPELLFGQDCYGPEIDIWSVGCVFAELIRQEPLFDGHGELDQIDQIFTLLGTPDNENWPSFCELPDANVLRWKPRPIIDRDFARKFPVAEPLSTKQAILDIDGAAMLSGLLTLEPSRRLTATQALQHAYLIQDFESSQSSFGVQL